MHCPVRYEQATNAARPTGTARWCGRCRGWHAVQAKGGRQRRTERRLAERRAAA